jgi:octaprenyl-diphosphate synthase
MMLALEKSEYKILHLVSDAVKEMSEGELLQIQKARMMNITEDVYYQIIRKKTASLIAACCASGVASVSEKLEHVDRMKLFGEYVGLAFQIKDDLLDFDPDNATGKPAQNDLKEQKMSLPLIYTLEKVDFFEKRKLLSYVKNHGSEKKKVKVIIDRIKSVDGFAYAEKRMSEFRDKALEILAEFPDSVYNRSLEKLVLFTTDRKY